VTNIKHQKKLMESTIITAMPTDLLAPMLALLLLAGCTTSDPSSSIKAPALKPTEGAGIDLSKYRMATVIPFNPVGSDIDASVGVKFANDVALRLQVDFGPIFEEVRKEGPALGTNTELIVTGTIRKYRPGDRVLRGVLIGLGATSFRGDLILKDGAEQRVLFSAPFDKLWAWGGYLGMSRGIEDIVSETAATVAATVARAKGWRPPRNEPNPK
jgi:hypothetical protein